MTEDTINNDLTVSGAGDTLLAGRYRVVRQLGHGGMGSVWLAEDTKLDGLRVAVKLLPSALVSNRRAYAQLKAEALVSLRLSHPNIATVRAFEENGGNPFLVIDYIDGQTLDEYLARKGALDEATAYALLEPVARALDYAHEKGVVHRDVKPGNVMITWDGEPFVLDFGIAREIQETMTRVTGKLSSGTLLYMSPEQLKGAAPRPAQDVYSFAAMAYECMRGVPPFSRGQVEWQILNLEPEPLSGGTFATSVMRGLAKDPSQRPKTCRGVLAAVRPRPPAGMAVPPADGRRAWNGKWLALAMIVMSLVAVFLNVDFESPDDGPVAPPPLPPPPPAEEANDALGALNIVRLDAQAKIVMCRQLDRRDGFDVKVEECEKEFARANDEYEARRWDDALRGYRVVLERCLRLVALDGDRYRARDAAKSMENQAHAAKESGADRYATNRFEAAKRLIVEAKDDFNAMRFSDAAEKHVQAARQFELAAGEARNARPPQPSQPMEPPPRPPPQPPKSHSGEKGEKTVLLPNGVPLEMVWCDSGVLSTHRWGMVMKRELRGFWISKYELTQKQWGVVMGENPSEFKGDDLPVENLSWNECMRYVEGVNAKGRATFRLPTGDEWEYAALGGHRRAGAGESAEDVTNTCWCAANSDGRTHRGGGRQGNPLGLHDMIGNVWEWCADEGDGKDASKRELRGGAFYTRNFSLLTAGGWMLWKQGERGRGAGMRLVCDRL